MSSGATVMSRLPLKNIWSKKNFDDLIMTAYVMTACMCSVWVFVNTEAPWLGAIQTACYIKFYADYSAKFSQHHLG
jgi:hypothetical protein